MMETILSAVAAATVTSIGFVIHLGSRVAVLEAKHEGMEEWLSRVEAKLDRVIEGGR